MAEGGLSPEQLFQNTVKFAKLGPERGVNNFVISGPINVPTDMHTFAGLYPRTQGGEAVFALLGFQSQLSKNEMYRRILRQQIPDRVKALSIRDNKGLRNLVERTFAMINFPSIALGLGSSTESFDEVVALFVAQGISPMTALQEIQERARKRLVW